MKHFFCLLFFTATAAFAQADETAILHEKQNALVSNQLDKFKSLNLTNYSHKRFEYIDYMFQTLANLTEGKDAVIDEAKKREIAKFLGFNSLQWDFGILEKWIWQQKNIDLQKKLWDVLLIFKGNGWTQNNLNGKVAMIEEVPEDMINFDGTVLQPDNPLHKPNKTELATIFRIFDNYGNIIGEKNSWGTDAYNYEYDTWGRIILRQRKEIKSEKIYSTQKYAYLKNGEKHELMPHVFEVDMSSSYDITYAYDMNGNVTNMNYLDGSTIAQKFNYTYTKFDHENNWIERNVEQIDDDGKITKTTEKRTIRYHQ